MDEPTFEQALEVLGVTVEAVQEEVRRAYLRRLKTCKPEHDPEGFMRLRRAFELVRDQIDWRRVEAGELEDRPTPPVAAPPRASRPWTSGSATTSTASSRSRPRWSRRGRRPRW